MLFPRTSAMQCNAKKVINIIKCFLLSKGRRKKSKRRIGSIKIKVFGK